MLPESIDQPGRATTFIAGLVTAIAAVTAVVATVTGAIASVPSLHLGAADAQLAGAFRHVEDAAAPGGAYVHVDKQFGRKQVFDAESGAVFCFEVTEPGDYSISGEIMGANNGANSFFVRLDYHDPWVWEFATSREYISGPVTHPDGNPVSLSLEVGQHVMGFYHRESGSRLAGITISGATGIDAPETCDREGSGEAPTPPTTQDGGTTSSEGTAPTTSESPASSTSEASTTSSSQPPTTSTTTAKTTTTSQAPTTTVGGGFDVAISPSDDVNSILEQHPEGTSFLLRAGTYSRLTLQPKSGQTITGENGTVLDGKGTTSHAIGEGTAANDITLRNLKITNYTEFGVAWGAQGAGKNWTIVNCEITSNYVGVRLKSGGTIRNSHIHHNTTYGVLSAGTVVVVGNDVSYNHAQGYPGGAAGGLLLGRASNSVISDNHIHHNYTIGLHLDGEKQNVLIEGNTIEDNENAGISYELGGSGLIRGNVVRRNGSGTSGQGGDGAGIMIIGATDVTVQGNRVEANMNGIVGRQPDRTNSSGELWQLRNLRVRDNIVSMTQGWTGIYDRVDGEPSLDANNVFEGNSYTVSGENFRWGSDRMTLAGWQEIHPNDG